MSDKYQQSPQDLTNVWVGTRTKQQLGSRASNISWARVLIFLFRRLCRSPPVVGSGSTVAGSGLVCFGHGDPTNFGDAQSVGW